MSSQLRPSALCLIGLILSLLLVGIVSGTLPRHLVQVSPAALVLTAVALRARWTAHAALPIFVFWIAIMILIWLYLLRLATIVTGHFTPVEIALTLVIGACSVRGILAALRASKGTSLASRILMFAVFAAMQMGAMWLSFREPFAHRPG